MPRKKSEKFTSRVESRERAGEKGAPYLGLAKEIINFIDFNKIFIIYEVFDAGSKNIRIFEKFPLECAREQSISAVWVS
jgi:hypothetical protein